MPTQTHPFLRALVPEHRAVVLQGAQDATALPGEILFREGHPANRLYLVHEGRVALETHVPAKGDIVISTVGPSQVLGWSWLVPPFVWHFQGRAMEELRMTVLDGGHLLVASEQNHFLGYELMKNISRVLLDALLVAHQRWLSAPHYPPMKTSGHAPTAVVDMSWPLEERLAEQPFFHRMRPEYLKTLAELAQPQEWETGQTLFNAGTPAEGLFVLERGSVVVESPELGRSVPLQTIHAGDAVGWSSFSEPYEWHFDGRATEPTSALYFKAADLRERCAGNYHFGYDLNKRISRMMLQHLQNTRNRMWETLR